jgi:hypothetical protein
MRVLSAECPMTSDITMAVSAMLSKTAEILSPALTVS